MPETENRLPLELVARLPLPGTAVPSTVAFSPDDRHVTYLRSTDRSLSLRLFAWDPESAGEREIFAPTGAGDTEANLSADEKLRRERLRERAVGVTRYAWAATGARGLVPLAGLLHVLDEISAAPRTLALGDHEHPVDPRMSRDGTHVAYVHEDELWVAALDGTTPPRRLTTGARERGVTHGLAEYVAQEEMGRLRGHWWSWDGSTLAFAEVDERAIPEFRIQHQGREAVTGEAEETHRYPFAGGPNARVRLGLVPRSGGTPRLFELDPGTEYLARVHFMPDGRLLAEMESRAQDRLTLVEIDPVSGRRRELVSEHSEVWINLHDDFHPLEHGEGELAGGFVWSSERTGFRHLYLHDRDGRVVRPLTSGEWPVDRLLDIDEARGLVYFVAGKDDPRQRHLWVTPLSGGPPRRLTEEPGTHAVVLDHGLRRFVDTHSSTTRPPWVSLRSLDDGSVLAKVHADDDPRLSELALPPPELVTLSARDGAVLHGAVYRPDPHKGGGPFPTIVSVYGGPHAQRVVDAWDLTVDMRAQYLRSLGYLVFRLDNRGSARRGLAFEGAIRHDLGNLEIRDQVDGVAWLVQRGLADAGRVAIMGWSYGGYLAAMALGRAPETFAAAVAGAPVTHWDGYDTHYTERYMGTPAGNREGYVRSSVMAHVEAMRGKLLLVHGLIDENVHFRHTARLIDALIDAGKSYELLLFPNERHLPRQVETRIYMEERIRDFLARSL